MIIPRYISIADVQTRLYNKVNFTGATSLINPNFIESDVNVGLTDDQTATFINQAVAHVEFVLSPLYVVPFVTTSGLAYANLPPSTLDLLNNLFINRSCALILQTEFAKDTGVKGENFIKNLDDQWNDYIDNRLLKRSQEGKYQYPPLLGLLTNSNQYDLSAPMSAPVKICTGNNDALAYANRHMNNPAIKLFYPYFGFGNYPYGNGS